ATAVPAALLEKLDEVLAQQQVISHQQQVLHMSVTGALASMHLPASSLGSAARQSLRTEVLTKYAAVDSNGWIWCVVTGQFWPALADISTMVPYVRASHIFQRKWALIEWLELDLGPSPDTPVNVIPMHGGVERAFDALQLLVLPNQAEEDGETIFTVHVLDRELLPKTVYGEYKRQQHKNSTTWVEPPFKLASITFQDIDKKPLKFVAGSDMRPAKRCFLAHAAWALVLAKGRKWQVDPGISLTVDSFGWQSPTFMETRERTSLWVRLQQKTVGIASELQAGSVGSS
ncbi:hypothetical protein TSOC_009135, partial [Tetrabaena socialis]